VGCIGESGGKSTIFQQRHFWRSDRSDDIDKVLILWAENGEFEIVDMRFRLQVQFLQNRLFSNGFTTILAE
jgi:hypothetical protein